MTITEPTKAQGQIVGYRRVSTLDQSTTRQLDGVEVNRAFEDKLSGKDTNRPQLAAMLSHVRQGDTVVVHSLDRLGRNLDDLRRIVMDLTGRGVRVKFIKENLEFSGDDSPMSMLLLNIMASFAQFERELIKERQREGITIAKREGIYKGRKPSLTPETITAIRKRVEAGEQKAALAAEYGVSRMTLYSALKAQR
jgi:DNA invertase Pin-like site-specific DNA recombinase